MAKTPASIARRLRFHQLELVAELAERGSLSGAASSLHISRTAVSKALRELENLLDIELFDRSVKGMTPTPAGARVARHARLLLNELHHMTQEVSAQAQTQTQAAPSHLRIGLPPFVAAYIAPGVLQRLRAQMPGREIAIYLHEGRIVTLIEQLLLGQLDAVLTLYAPRDVEALDLSMLTIRHCADAPMVVVAAPSLGIAKRKRHKWADLLRHPWILPTDSTNLRRSLNEMFTAGGTRAPQPAIESGSLAANVRMAASGLGIAVVPAQSAQADVDAGTLQVLLMQQPMPPTSVVLMYRKVSAIYMDAIAGLDKAAEAVTNAR